MSVIQGEGKAKQNPTNAKANEAAPDNEAVEQRTGRIEVREVRVKPIEGIARTLWPNL